MTEEEIENKAWTVAINHHFSETPWDGDPTISVDDIISMMYNNDPSFVLHAEYENYDATEVINEVESLSACIIMEFSR